VHDVTVAIPAHNEQDRIEECLRALALQEGPERHAVVLLANNCTDGTEDLARALLPRLPCKVYIERCSFPPAQATAGHARRRAMQLAAARTRAGGVLMTTDADSRVAPDWVAANLAAIRRGADVVCGRALIDPEEAVAIPEHLHADDAVECAYDRLLDAIHNAVDPDPADPWPRHTEHSGASIALRAALLDGCGGVPAVALGEDRAFLAALRRIDARVRHAPEVTVVVSGRLEGRAAGGMADTMRRRILQQDDLLDDRLEPALDCLRRAAARRRFAWVWRRRDGGAAMCLARRLGVSAARMDACVQARFFGAGWDTLEAASPVLARRLVPRAEVGNEVAMAQAVLRRLGGDGSHADATAPPSMDTYPASASLDQMDFPIAQ
jgi:GT2 family glycosyltransferase